MGLVKWLQGKKTYIVAVAGIIGAIAAFATGETSMIGTIEAILVALGMTTIRAGISKIGQ